MKKTLIIFLLLSISLSGFAHEGGHGHTNNHENERNWTYKGDSLAAKGSFLLVKENQVYVESDGKVIHLDINQLSDKDLAYINFKAAIIASINAHSSPNTPPNHSHALMLIAGICFALLSFGLFIFRNDKKRQRRLSFGILLSFGMIFTIVSCSKDSVLDELESLITSVSDPEVVKAAFDPYTNVTTSWDDDYFYVSSNGIPEHQMMTGITAWIAQVPIPQPYSGDNSWSIPLKTKYAAAPISIEGSFQRGAIAIAANGIPIFNPINASGLISNEIGELDNFGGHSGRGDDYHYHTAPLHLQGTSGNHPIAYALDGYAVYGTKEPDGSAMTALDENHGHEYTDGSYHYHGTESYPYMIAAMRGEVALEGEAPQNQITPQPRADPPRADPHPINSDDLLITDLVAKTEGNGYVLSYTSQGKQGSVDYSWDENDLFTFIFYDIDGSTTTETFQRK